VKLNKSVIIKGKMMNGYKVLMCGRNMNTLLRTSGLEAVGIMEVPMRLISITDPFAA
jgi:hypothetical protein